VTTPNAPTLPRIDHTTPIAQGVAIPGLIERLEIDFASNRYRIVYHHIDPQGTFPGALLVGAVEGPLSDLIPPGAPAIATLCARMMAAIVAAKNWAGASVGALFTP
jgi:hypothetical protein